MLTDLTPGRDDADDALRNAGLLEQLGHEERVERRLGRRLDDDRASGEERRRELRHRHELRDVPRHDRADDADTFAADDDVTSEHTGPLLLPRVLGADLEEGVEHHPRRRALRQLRERDGRAHLLGDDRRHVHHPGGVDVAEVLDDLGPLGGRHARPVAVVERVAGRGYGAVDVGLGAFGHPAHQLLAVRRDHVDRVTAGRVDPLATDEQLVVRAHPRRR